MGLINFKLFSADGKKMQQIIYERLVTDNLAWVFHSGNNLIRIVADDTLIAIFEIGVFIAEIHKMSVVIVYRYTSFWYGKAKVF